jgi:uncharacterized protein
MYSKISRRASAFVAEGLTELGFNVEEMEGANLSSSLGRQSANGKTRIRYASFIGGFLERNRRASYPLRVREFHALAQNIRKHRQDQAYVPLEAEQRMGAILTMTKTGLMFSWSPELASASTRQSENLCLGDVHSIRSIDELFLSNRARFIQAEIDAGIRQCRKECDYFNVCGGGSPGNKFFENGTFASTETLKCMLQIQELTQVVIKAFTPNTQQ